MCFFVFAKVNFTGTIFYFIARQTQNHRQFVPSLMFRSQKHHWQYWNDTQWWKNDILIFRTLFQNLIKESQIHQIGTMSKFVIFRRIQIETGSLKFFRFGITAHVNYSNSNCDYGNDDNHRSNNSSNYKIFPWPEKIVNFIVKIFILNYWWEKSICRNFKKSRQKNSWSQINQYLFFAISKMAKSQFLKWEKSTKNAISWKNFLFIYLTSRVFLPGLF